MKKFNFKMKRVFCMVLVICMTLSFSGCFTMSTEDLYSLPQLNEEYVQLQNKINEVLDTEAEYSAPTAGSHRQAVQFEDIDGDGENEAIAFFSQPSDDMPLKIYIYERIGDTYEFAAVIEGSGTNIRSIDYTDLNNDGMEEIVVGWQIAAGVSMISVYSLSGYKVVQLFSTDYTSYTVCNMSESDGNDIVVIRNTPSELTGEAEIYSQMPDGEIVSSVARLSSGIESVSTVKTSRLSDGKSAVFIESAIDENSTVTDILAYADSALKNITMRTASSVSQGTVRSYNISSTDINNDGIFEVPTPVLLEAQTESATNYYMIEWYAYDSDGNRELSMTTYHDFSDGWYLVFPEGWNGNVTVRRDDSVSGERALIFSYIGKKNKEPKDFLVIYTLSGDDMDKAAHQGNRVVILERNKTIYAEEILAKPNSIKLTLSDDIITENFNIIYSELET